MKKIFLIFLLNLMLNNMSLADSFYFKECKLSSSVTGNYIINLEENVVEVELTSLDGKVQYFADKIKSIEKNKIITEKIKSTQADNIYYQYFFNAKAKTVLRLQYKKESGIDIDLFNLVGRKVNKCLEIKGGWDKKKIEEANLTKEQKKILEEQEKIKKETSLLIECQGDDYTKWNNCTGNYQSETGHKYNGLFKKGNIVKGISIYPGGSKYVGDFKDFKPHGYGSFVWINGDKYFGDWNNGKAQGRGTKAWNDGRQYIGTFNDDKIHGNGTLFYPDGKKYIGEFLNGKRHGQGTFYFPDGTSYIGKFIVGKEKGLGECVAKDGSSVPCKSKNTTQKKDFSGKDIKKIKIISKKWVRVSQYEANSKRGKKVMNKLKEDFKTEAQAICASKGNYDILEQNIEVVEIDETPAYGLETVLKLAIYGAIECI